MNLTVVTPPPFEPVTLAEVYRQLRIVPDVSGSPPEESHPDDELLRGQITAAREYVEIATRRALVQQTLRWSSADFPCAWGRFPRAWPSTAPGIVLPRPPLIRINSVGYYGADNVFSEVPSSDYYVMDQGVPELRFVSGYVTPSVYDRADAVRVEYVAGYTPDGSPPMTQEDFTRSIPQTLKNAILIGVQLLYDSMPPADRIAMENMREAMLQTYRIQHIP